MVNLFSTISLTLTTPAPQLNGVTFISGPCMTLTFKSTVFNMPSQSTMNEPLYPPKEVPVGTKTVISAI